MCNSAIVLLISFFILSCSTDIKYTEVKKTSQASNASLPESLIRELSNNFLKENPDLNINIDKIYNKFGFYKKIIWPVSLKIWPKSGDLDIARHFNLKGGAVRVDINRFVKQLENSDDFYLQLELSAEKFNKLFVYFLPSYKNDKTCNTFYNVTNFYHEKLSKKVMLSKQDNHYAENYLGTYIFFSVLNKGAYQLNLVQITDSSLGDKVCHYF